MKRLPPVGWSTWGRSVFHFLCKVVFSSKISRFPQKQCSSGAIKLSDLPSAAQRRCSAAGAQRTAAQ